MPGRTKSSKKFWNDILSQPSGRLAILDAQHTGFAPVLVNKSLCDRLVKKYGFRPEKFGFLDFEYVTLPNENCVYVGDRSWISVHKVYVRDNMAVCDCPTFKFKCKKEGRPCNHILFLMVYGIWKPEYFLGYV